MRIGWNLVTVCCLAAGLAATWFIGLQVFSIGHLCPWCLAAHGCGIILGGIVLWLRPAQRKTWPMLGLAIIGVACLAGTQIVAEPPPTYQIEYFPAAQTAEDGTTTTGTDTATFAPPSDDE